MVPIESGEGKLASSGEESRTKPGGDDGVAAAANVNEPLPAAPNMTLGRRLRDAFTPKASIGKASAVLLGVAAFVLILAVWSLLSYGGFVDPLFLPSPAKTWASAVTMFSGGFVVDIWATVYRVMGGFIIAAVIGVPLGVLVGAYAPVSAFLSPLFSFLRYMPASAFIPLFIFWIGLDEKEKMAIIILGSLPQIVLMVANNIASVDRSLIEASYTLGTTRASVLWKIIFHKTLPDIVDTLRIVLGWAWTYVIVAELVGASSGIGYTILQAQRTVLVGKIFVGILTLGIIGLIVDNVLVWASKAMFPWREE
ncbi:MAG: ABC transporter permease [Bifidobacterium subtile]|jgi:NitT/TauT family transport system permease protein|nr:ABC transporter permease [Bifidobacterium subtile]